MHAGCHGHKTGLPCDPQAGDLGPGTGSLYPCNQTTRAIGLVAIGKQGTAKAFGGKGKIYNKAYNTLGSKVFTGFLGKTAGQSQLPVRHIDIQIGQFAKT